MTRPFASLLIANRGEIAVRVARTARRLAIRTIAVYSDADANAAHVAAADEAVHIGPSPASDSYLRVDRIIDAARKTRAEAIHPGYGFLSENADFAEACAAAGIVFVGPPAAAIRAMGFKDRAKEIMAKAGVAVVPGYQGSDQSDAVLAKEAGGVGYPVLIKAVAGGGGKGMRRVDGAAEFAGALASARREAQSAFGDDRVLVEKYVSRPRHIEVQIFGDSRGHVIHLFERDCSLQRRHQKVIEEAPAPGMSAQMRAKIGEAGVKAAKAVSYVGAGTVEFIADASEGLKADRIWFMEMNTRLQVEHPVTEAITGLDLVEWQLRVAAGEPLPKTQKELHINGHAIEARLYAEDPAREFLPSVGLLERLKLPDGTGAIRVDAGVRQGDTVSTYYDPMIAKVIAWAPSREEAAILLSDGLAGTEVAGVHSNAGFLVRALRQPDFLSGDIDTAFIERHQGDLMPAPLAPPIVARAAQLLVSERRTARKSRDPWNAQDGFRLSGEGQEVMEFVVAGKRTAVKVVHHRGGAESFLHDGKEVHPAGHVGAMRLASGDVAVMEAGDTYVLPLHDPMVAAQSEGAAGEVLTAPMPGKIVQIFVKPGDKVARGTPLAVLEAMKMEHTLSAQGDARIAAIDVGQGEQVREGAVVVRFAKPHKAA